VEAPSWKNLAAAELMRRAILPAIQLAPWRSLAQVAVAAPRSLPQALRSFPVAASAAKVARPQALQSGQRRLSPTESAKISSSCARAAQSSTLTR
jgi:hypothetical protein